MLQATATPRNAAPSPIGDAIAPATHHSPPRCGFLRSHDLYLEWEAAEREWGAIWVAADDRGSHDPRGRCH